MLIFDQHLFWLNPFTAIKWPISILVDDIAVDPFGIRKDGSVLTFRSQSSMFHPELSIDVSFKFYFDFFIFDPKNSFLPQKNLSGVQIFFDSVKMQKWKSFGNLTITFFRSFSFSIKIMLSNFIASIASSWLQYDIVLSSGQFLSQVLKWLITFLIGYSSLIAAQ